MTRNPCAYNNTFWEFVKQIVKEKKSICKPCKYFESHKKEILDKYNKAKYQGNNNTNSNEKN